MAKGYHIENVKTPFSGRVVMENVYWLCKDGDPCQAIFFNDVAQCNKHKEIPERMLQYTMDKTGWDIEIVFFDIAFRPQVNF